jgi:hypothetical protein
VIELWRRVQPLNGSDAALDQGGSELRYAASEAEAMRAIIRDRLRRRLSAPKRIGCPYRLTAFSAAPGFDASSWLPGEVMAKFFSQGDK